MSESEQMNYASFNYRMLASLIDTVLSTIVLVPLFSLFNNLAGIKTARDFMNDPAIVANGLSLEQQQEIIRATLTSFSMQSVVFAVIIIAFWIYKSATPGKMILNMKIVDAKTGEKPSRNQLIIRYFGYIVSTIPLCLGFIWVFYDKKRQGWHDKMAGTVVIRKKKTI